MKIKDLLSPRAIRLNAPAESKSQAIDALVELHAAAGNLTDPSAYRAPLPSARALRYLMQRATAWPMRHWRR